MQTATVIIKGGYQPAELHLQAQQSAQITFQQEDSSSCLSTVQSTALGFNEKIPLGTHKTVTIAPQAPGVYNYACGMNMFQGKVVYE
ncbi:cupredoxin domain-containing protein [Bombilactobacillus bombi]|uniref:cupredoxin domain-containing protein n=1 Tax=Bombilactobacillus bombi TaxID=1303590 RepID=UPI0015E5CA30|nr:cupredoxin domain-containing protein [Bombilactobacillus bombi]MBA1393623.1 cupredoxin domain-containing protein [Lactobacillus sp. XV13L]MBA1434485.1 cupredoxin domain-containing protein [Bombilactobacillus bombi]